MELSIWIEAWNCETSVDVRVVMVTETEKARVGKQMRTELSLDHLLG